MLERRMAELGYLEGKRMANAFNMLRSHELIWPYVVNNYLKGKKPMPFDLLYWNSDATRMPAANHSFYLRNCYLENKLSKGEMEVGGEKLDLSKVKIPVYNLATREDHIAPAKSVFLGLASSSAGRCASCWPARATSPAWSIPPAKNKYQYWTGGKPTGAARAVARRRPRNIPARGGRTGSHGCARSTTPQVAAREPGGGKLKPIEDAPGSYVKVRA